MNVAVNASGKTVAGIDVGGTTIKARTVAVGPDGATPFGAGIRRPTPTHDPDAALETIADVVASLRTNAELEAVGVVVPGIIDEPNGIAVFQANLGWNNTPIVDRLRQATGLPVALGHDVRGGGLAEWRLGAGRQASNLLFVMLGTGIGSAVVVDGRMLTADGYAGQLGHIAVAPAATSLPCGCGGHGCLATLASASGVVRRYAERAGNPDVTEAREVAERARSGDPDAVIVWGEAVGALVTGLTIAVTMFGSEVVVLGGGLALAGDQLLEPVAERLDERLTFQRRPRLVRAELGDESAILGAALLAANAVRI